MNNLVNPPSVNDLLDQGFDLQYFNPPTEYPVKLEDDWYLKFIKGPIKVTNSPIVPNKKGELSMEPQGCVIHFF